MPFNPKIVGFAQPPSDDAVAEQAAKWVAAKDRGLNPDESKALLEWLEASPRHASEYGRILRSWNGLDALAADEDLNARVDEVEVFLQARRRRLRRLSLAGVGLAAAIAAAVTALLGHGRVPLPSPPPPPAPAAAAPVDYTVLPSTVRRQVLADGSIAELNGDSRIETQFTVADRRVRLVQGEANFIVAKNPERPFIVSAGTVMVRAVGTTFNVRLSPGQVEVLVSEGRVRVTSGARPAVGKAGLPGAEPAAKSVAAHERAVVNTARPAAVSVTVDRPSPAEFEQALAWKSTRLVFDHTPLDEVVAAFNRYNSRKITLADPSLRGRTLTGIFRTDNLDGFLRLLPASADVVAEAGSDGRTLLRAEP